ncbi:hypothetical protein EP331_13450 [bacterium]|nr:MAG: hypothetical protein EP331_13450 [bacterium]
MKPSLSQSEAEALYQEFLTEFIKKEERKTTAKKVVLGILFSLVITLLIAIVHTLVLSDLAVNSKRFSEYGNQIYREATFIKENQNVFTKKNFDNPAYTASKQEEVTLISDSLTDDKAFRYPYLIKTKTGITGRTGYLIRERVPHFTIHEQVSDLSQISIAKIQSSFNNLFMIRNPEFRHLRAYSFFVLNNPAKAYFYIELLLILGLVFVIKTLIINPVYSKYDAKGYNLFSQFKALGITLGLALGLFSSFAETDSAIFFTSGYQMFMPPSGDMFDSFMIFIVWGIFILSALFLLGLMSSVQEKHGYNYLVFPFLFAGLIAIGFLLFSLLTFSISALFSYFLEVIGGWSSLIEILIVLGIIIGLMLPSIPKTDAQIKAERQEAEERYQRRKKIEKENEAIRQWNFNNQNNQRTLIDY